MTSLTSAIGSMRAALDAPTWAQADDALRATLDAHADHPWAYGLRQEGATTMLTRHLLPAAPSPERDAAIGFYARALIESGSPDARLIAQSIGEVGDGWTATQIAEARADARRNVVAFAGGAVACADAACEAYRVLTPADAAPNPVAAYVVEGLPALGGSAL